MLYLKVNLFSREIFFFNGERASKAGFIWQGYDSVQRAYYLHGKSAVLYPQLARQEE